MRVHQTVQVAVLQSVLVSENLSEVRMVSEPLLEASPQHLVLLSLTTALWLFRGRTGVASAFATVLVRLVVAGVVMVSVSRAAVMLLVAVSVRVLVVSLAVLGPASALVSLLCVVMSLPSHSFS